MALRWPSENNDSLENLSQGHEIDYILQPIEMDIFFTRFSSFLKVLLTFMNMEMR